MKPIGSFRPKLTVIASRQVAVTGQEQSRMTGLPRQLREKICMFNVGTPRKYTCKTNPHFIDFLLDGTRAMNAA
jgi:hypothetical protein